MSVAGLRGTGDFGTAERPKSFREMILFRNPKGSSPIFALTARARKMTVDDPEFNWWDEPNTNIRLQVNDGDNIGAAETLVTVDSSDPSESSPGGQYGLATHLKAGDLLMVEKTTEAADIDNELIEVVNVVSDTQFTVRRGVAGTTAAQISNDDNLLLIGSAYAEGTAAPEAVARNPIKYNNFTQIFKDTYEITGTVNETKTRTGEAWSNDKKRKTFDHARGIEWAIMYGQKHETTGDNGKPKRYMGGLRQQIATVNQTIFTTAVTITSFLDAVYPVFDWDTEAGDERILMMGNKALNSLNKVIQSDSNTDIQYGGKIEVFGMQLNEWLIPQGRLLFRTHPLLNQHPVLSKSGFILDFSVLRYVALRNRDTKPKDDVQTKDEDVRRGYYQTECSLRVDMGGLTCGYLGNVTD